MSADLVPWAASAGRCCCSPRWSGGWCTAALLARQLRRGAARPVAGAAAGRRGGGDRAGPAPARLAADGPGRPGARPAVLDALVDAVLRNAWEPADRRAVQWLRLWAHGERAARPTPAASPPHAAAARAPRPAADGRLDRPVRRPRVPPAPPRRRPATPVRLRPAGPVPARGPRARHRAATDATRRRTRPRIAAGSETTTISTDRRPARRPARRCWSPGPAAPPGSPSSGRWPGDRPVVAADCDPAAVGLHLATDAGVVPARRRPRLRRAGRQAGRPHRRARALVCTVGRGDRRRCTTAPRCWPRPACGTWLPPPRASPTCTDKWPFARACAAAGSRSRRDRARAPSVGGARAVDRQAAVRPRLPRRRTPSTRPPRPRWALRRVPDPLVQTRLTGPRVHRRRARRPGGPLAGAVPALAAGDQGRDQHQGPHVRRPRAGRGRCAGCWARSGLTGPANVQGFVADAARFTFTEVNPRFSGGLPLSLAAGRRPRRRVPARARRPADPPRRLVARPGVTMLRHFVRGLPPMRLLVPFGTRPEIVKLAPVVRALRAAGRRGRRRRRPASTTTPA